MDLDHELWDLNAEAADTRAEDARRRGAFDVVGPTAPARPLRPRTCVLHTDCDAADPGERHAHPFQDRGPVVVRDPAVPKDRLYFGDQDAFERRVAASTGRGVADALAAQFQASVYPHPQSTNLPGIVPSEPRTWDDIVKAAHTESGNPKDAIGDTKPPLHLVPAALGIYTSQAMKDGARKYGPFNWRTKPVRAEVYVAACMRHLASWYDGEDHAGDSGVHHLGHAAACLAILLDAMATENLIDDRPTPGPAARLIADFTTTKEQAA